MKHSQYTTTVLSWKSILPTIAMSLLPMCASAQNESYRVSVIPHAGTTISKISGDSFGDSDWKAGYTLGAGVEIPLSQCWSVMTGADFSLIGGNYGEQKGQDETSKKKLNLTYVTIPVQIKTYISELGGLSVRLGLQAGILASAKDVEKTKTRSSADESAGKWVTTKTSQDVSASFRNFVTGLTIGAGYEWRHVVVDATYCYELRKAAVNKNTVYANTPTAHNHAIYITAGYKFTL